MAALAPTMATLVLPIALLMLQRGPFGGGSPGELNVAVVGARGPACWETPGGG